MPSLDPVRFPQGQVAGFMEIIVNANTAPASLRSLLVVLTLQHLQNPPQHRPWGTVSFLTWPGWGSFRVFRLPFSTMRDPVPQTGTPCEGSSNCQVHQCWSVLGKRGNNPGG